jgi:TRAP-type mannitol/chloroaromatic compound transport system permease large subunit
MAAFAFAMLAVGLALMVTTGWASYAVLLGVAAVIAAAGVVSGGIDASLLLGLPGRIVGLLEHDLLQAVALYAFIGALLRHGGLADSVFAAFSRALGAMGSGPALRGALAGYGLGVLAAPMNGSVGASVSLLSHSVAPRWRAGGLGAARTCALTAVTATLGAIVPPSLVLLLLGDAMLRAHTEGLHMAHRTAVRVINTQDVIQACLPAALLLTAAWAAVAAWQARRSSSKPHADQTFTLETPHPSAVAGWVAALAVLGLLALVAIGYVRAVEAAATAALAALGHAVLSGGVSRGRLARVFDDAMALTGALFALLLAAATLSYMLRAAGCDVLVANALARLSGQPRLATATVLAGLLLMAFVLDAFELVFLVVPIVMPPLLSQVPDASWVACLTLLTLQAGFLLPPWGYAVVMTRSLAGSAAPRTAALARELLPYLAALAAVALLIFVQPGLTGWLRTAPDSLAPTVPLQDVDELLRAMSPQR